MLRRLRRFLPFVSKADLINRLAAIRRYRRYLEICTRTTGGQYTQIDRTLLTSRHQLRSMCPTGRTRGPAPDFRSETRDICSLP